MDAPSVNEWLASRRLRPVLPHDGEEQGGASMAALFRGPLVVKDGCVLIGQLGEYSLPLWWSGFTAEPDRSGRIAAGDADGAVVAVEGETFAMGGAELSLGVYLIVRGYRRDAPVFDW